MADNYRVLDGLKAFRDFAAKEISSVLYPKHIIAGPDGVEQNLLAALQALAPASGHAAVTPHNSTPLADGVRALYIGTGGDIVVTVDGDDVTYTVADGQVLTLNAELVKSTGTTATDIVAWF